MCGFVDGNKMVVAGGLNKDGYMDSVEIYDMMNDKWDMGELVVLRGARFSNLFSHYVQI